ncbi:peptidoglycan-binding domain-containing protein [Pseudooceanicola sp. C21-150M6]|uniref:peptidoglycan-binding domain-containing protein n=1 Tax=Pseudooceanicola sp. C21-150M6 TaxID=3434355 RepID=UPI003D7FA042
MTLSPRFAVPVIALLAACDVPLPVPEVGPSELIELRPSPPDNPDPSACWRHEATPAVVETVTEHVVVQPAQVLTDGTVAAPGAYRTETRQRIVEERQEFWFRAVCPEAMTPDLISSLQRALDARGMHPGSVTGSMDRATLRAVRRYQAPLGLDSSILSMAAARKLGLSVVERPVDPTAG